MNAAANHAKLLDDIAVTVSVELGRVDLPLKKVLALGPESVVPLDRLTDELLDVMVNGHTIARAEVVTQENKFALRIVELVGVGPMPDPVPDSPSPAADGLSEAASAVPPPPAGA
ncbi:FliM/FliN family flagellar motor switch protein [Erythrobacter sp. HA6-11]